MAAELLAGAFLGTAVSELLNVVKDVRSKISSFHQILDCLERTLTVMKPYMDEITLLKVELKQSGNGLGDLSLLIASGMELVLKCSKISPYNLVKKVQYGKRLIDLNGKLSWYNINVLQLEQSRDIKQILHNQHLEKEKEKIDGIKKPAQAVPIKLLYETSSSSVPVEKDAIFVSARDLQIEWSKNKQYWNWSFLTEPSSDHAFEVAELLKVWFLDVRGCIETDELQHGIEYKIVFVVMLIDSASGWRIPVKLKATLPDGSTQERNERFGSKPRNQWLEVIVGNFTMSPSTVGTIEFFLEETTLKVRKNGLLIKGAGIVKA